MAGSNNFSFGSGQENPDGLQLKLTFDEDTRTVYGEYRCPPKFQGDENTIHPGILSVILDENLYLRGWLVKKNRRVVENRAEIENEIGKIVARGKGKYIEKEEE